VSSATINRFFSLHFTLPFILAALVVGHLLYLHVSGSSNPVGTTSNADRTAFHPYFSFKDLVTVYLFFIIFTAIVFYAPDKLGRRMATFPSPHHNVMGGWICYNTICLNKIIVKCTQVINVIITKLILYLVKIIFTYILYIYILISRKLYDVINYKGSSETTCVYSYLDLHPRGPKVRGMEIVNFNYPPCLKDENKIIIEDKINVSNNDPDFIY
jgi:quinol-cytochrome oxidoreductase complex cytochrome b subunit